MEIAILCKQIVQLCHISGELQWEELFKYFVTRIEEGHIEATVREIEYIYGGMGSFNDLILQKNGKMLDTNTELYTLRKALFEVVFQG